jgi:hypothetical protein
LNGELAQVGLADAETLRDAGGGGIVAGGPARLVLVDFEEFDGERVEPLAAPGFGQRRAAAHPPQRQDQREEHQAARNKP